MAPRHDASPSPLPPRSAGLAGLISTAVALAFGIALATAAMLLGVAVLLEM